MSNMRLMWKNLWDDPDAIISASSEAVGFGKENVNHIWKNRRWRSTADTDERLKINFPDKLLNTGFEDWTAGYPDNWISGESGTSTINQDTVEQHEGSSCCRFDVDASNSDIYVYQKFDLQPNVRYRLKIWYKMNIAGKTAAYQFYTLGAAHYLLPDGTWTTTPTSNVLSNSTIWASETVDFYAHPNHTEFILLLLRYQTASASIYWDSTGVSAVFNSFALIGNNFTSNAVVNLQANTADGWGSPAFDEQVSPVSNKPLIHFFNDQQYNWWRIRIQDSQNSDTYVSVGRIFLGYYFEPTRGFFQPATKQYIDPSVKRYSAGGQVSINQKEKYIQAAYNFGSIHNDDLPYFKHIWDEVGQSKPYFLCESPASNPHESTYYVLNSQPWNISEMFSKSMLTINTEEMR